jgi:hypothetical protein
MGTQAIDIAKKDKRVPMFIWFVMKDSARQPLAERDLPEDGRCQARAKFAAAAGPLNARNTKLSVGRHQEPVRDGSPGRSA